MLLLSVALAWAGERTAPEVSTDRGEAGGVVVLWPRVVPSGRASVAMAAGWQVQQALVAAVQTVSTRRPLSTRPSPERVCPRDGCLAHRVGAVVIRKRQSCAVVATVGEPGTTSLMLVPWVGSVVLAAEQVPFRQPPESVVTVHDFVPCASLAEPLLDGGGSVRVALERALER